MSWQEVVRENFWLFGVVRSILQVPIRSRTLISTRPGRVSKPTAKQRRHPMAACIRSLAVGFVIRNAHRKCRYDMKANEAN